MCTSDWNRSKNSCNFVKCKKNNFIQDFTSFSGILTDLKLHKIAPLRNEF